MDDRLDIEQITKRLEGAFKPYRCVIKPDADYANGIRFHVLGKNEKPIIIDPFIPFSEIDTDSSLSSFIEQKKEEIRAKGYPIN